MKSPNHTPLLRGVSTFLPLILLFFLSLQTSTHQQMASKSDPALGNHQTSQVAQIDFKSNLTRANRDHKLNKQVLTNFQFGQNEIQGLANAVAREYTNSESPELANPGTRVLANPKNLRLRHGRQLSHVDTQILVTNLDRPNIDQNPTRHSHHNQDRHPLTSPTSNDIEKARHLQAPLTSLTSNDIEKARHLQAPLTSLTSNDIEKARHLQAPLTSLTSNDIEKARHLQAPLASTASNDVQIYHHPQDSNSLASIRSGDLEKNSTASDGQNDPVLQVENSILKSNHNTTRPHGSDKVHRVDHKSRDERGVSDISSVSNYASLMEEGSVGRSLKLCRQKTYLPAFLFRVHSCAACYHYQRNVPGMFGYPSRKWRTRVRIWKSTDGGLHEIMVLASLDPNSTVTIFANTSDATSPLLASFANENARRNWMDCCEAAERCCAKMEMQPPRINVSEPARKTCPATWDSWQCWNETEAGQTVYAPCPHYIYSVLSETSSCSLTAHKTCESDGNWYSKPGPGHSEWTNYSNCASSVIEVQKRRTYVHVTAYAVSIIAIIPALIIFFSYKQLRVDRIILHENLFTSMLVNGIFVIAFKTIIILNELSSDPSSATTIISENGIGCRLLFILTKYSRMTNYMWMFCEGYYLHKLIASAFAEQKSLLIFYLMGWVFPIIPTVIYASLRLGYSNERCWVVPEESFEWILNGPSLMSLLVNMLFLINIIRVLVTKLRAAHANEPSQYRKAVRATLVLLPLFGLHFVVTIYRPPASGSSGTCQWLEIYFYTNDILDGVQGFLVALIFCYLNGEVTLLLRRTYKRWSDEHGGFCDGPRNSSTRLQSRSSRGGSMLGRSVVSTQCYSSVPASPEVCCNINRLSFSSASQNTPQDKEKRQISPSDKTSLISSSLTVNGTRLSPTIRSTHGRLSPGEKVRGQETLSKSRMSSDAQALLSSTPPSTDTGEGGGVFEMKARQTVDSSSPPSSASNNGIKSEHEF